MSYLKVYQATEWEQNMNGETLSEAKPNIDLYVTKERARSGDHYVKYNEIDLITQNTMYKISPFITEYKGQDNKYHPIDGQLIISDFLKTFIEDEETKMSVLKNVNDSTFYKAIAWRSFDLEEDRFYADNSLAYYHDRLPYKAIFNSKEFVNDENNKCEDIALIIDFEDYEVKVVIHSTLELDHTTFEKNLKITDNLPKSWIWKKKLFIKTSNTKTNCSNEYCYYEEEVKRQ